jgi:foldase protein PrsA
VPPRLLGAVFAAAALAVAGCGDSHHDGLAEISGTPVTESAVRHLAHVLAAEHVPAPHGYTTLQRYALALLITADWVLGEARRLGVGVSDEEGARLVGKKTSSFTGGTAEVDEWLRVYGRTLSDVQLQEEVRLAVSRIVALLAGREPRITTAQVATYYGQNKERFATDEQRKVVLGHSGSRSFCDRIKHLLASSSPLPVNSVESLEYAAGGHPANEDQIFNAIYSAKLGETVGPVKDAGQYFVFKLTDIIPRKQEPLSAVADEIATELHEQQRRTTLTRFAGEWARTWAQRTACRSGWVVAQCRGYRGALSASQVDPFALG